MADDYQNFILNASSKDLIQQLNLEIKEPLTSAQATVNMLMMLQNPSPAVLRKIEDGEMDAGKMLVQLTDDITRVLDVIDYYRKTLESG